jgi:hypothetical protein
VNLKDRFEPFIGFKVPVPCSEIPRKFQVGLTGAQLANVANEAALLAARRRLPAITTAELVDATVPATQTELRIVTLRERVDQVDSHGRWKGPCLQTNPQCDAVVP